MRKLLFLLSFIFLFTACSKANSDDEVGLIKPEESAIHQVESEIVSTDDNIESLAVKYSIIPTGEHNSSAEVEINSDNTVILKNFYYDGKAPDVYIALGTFDESGNFVKGEVISPLIEGVYKGEDFKFNISSDINLDSYTAISIYCNQYSEDFSSSNLEDVN